MTNKPEFGVMYIATWRLKTKEGEVFARQPSFISMDKEVERGYTWLRIYLDINWLQIYLDIKGKEDIVIKREKGEPVEFEPVEATND